MREGYDLGIRNFYLQPGTYDSDLENEVKKLPEIRIIKSCVLIDLGSTHSNEGVR